MTDIETAPPANDTWEGLLQNLRNRYPGQKNSVLFCIHKLQQNPDATLRDFRAEADLHGIPMAGRSLHSARVLLGLVAETPKRQAEPVAADAEATAEPEASVRRRGAAKAGVAKAPSHRGDSIEGQVVAAMRQIQSAAHADNERLRAAIREAIALLQDALGDD